MSSCCVFGCQNRRNSTFGSKLKFYRIPADIPSQKSRRQLWLNAIRRTDWTETIINNARVCSAHFISGAKSDDPSSPDWVPSVFLQTTATKKRKRKKDVEKYEQSKREEEIKEQAAVAVLLKLSSVPAKPPEDEQKCDGKVCKEKIARLQKECNDLREENCRLKAILKSGTFHELALGKDDKKVKAMT
ncbi:uncharacterized protein [Paramisgurnus dabryanus]|uniref:uncharacterized protein isoform X2 n=1 Tax=Paramisgurnus dabryanus TaxID=90735 RepID=UPI0031F436C7